MMENSKQISLKTINKTTIVVTVVQSLIRIRLSAIPWTAALQVSLSSTISLSLLKLMSIELMPSNYLIPSPPSPYALSLSQHQRLLQ